MKNCNLSRCTQMLMFLVPFAAFALSGNLQAVSGAFSGRTRRRNYRPKGSVQVLFATLLLAALPAAASSVVTTTTLGVTSAGSAVTTISSGSVVTLTATVTAGTTPVTIGQVTFCDAAATYCTDIHVLGTAQLTSSGTATFNLRPGLGVYGIKAYFVGTTAYQTSMSATQNLTVTGTLPSSTALTLSGVAGNYTLTANVGGGGRLAPSGSVTYIDSSNGNATLATAAVSILRQSRRLYGVSRSMRLERGR